MKLYTARRLRTRRPHRAANGSASRSRRSAAVGARIASTPEYLAINPAGAVPALDVDGCES